MKKLVFLLLAAIILFARAGDGQYVLGSRSFGTTSTLTLPTFVDVSYKDNQASSSATVVIPADNHAAGNALVVLARWTTINSITNTAGDTFVQAPGTPSGDSIWYVCSSKGSSADTVTVNFSSSQSWLVAFVVQIHGTPSSGCLDTASGGTNGAGTSTVTSNGFSNTSAGDYNLALGDQGCGGSGWSADANYSVLVSNSGLSDVGLEGRANAPSGSQTASMTLNGATCTSSISVASFK